MIASTAHWLKSVSRAVSRAKLEGCNEDEREVIRINLLCIGLGSLAQMEGDEALQRTACALQQALPLPEGLPDETLPYILRRALREV